MGGARLAAKGRRGGRLRPSFAYHRPATLEEACRLLAAEPRAAVLAGGTDLMVHLRQPQRGKRPPAVVNVKRIRGLAEIHARLRHLRATDRDRGCMHSRVAGFDVRRLLILVLFLTVVGLLS